jgi:hypothetical membrane protein
MQMNWRRVGALAGMIGPFVFMVMFMLLGWIAPNYDPRRTAISELALTPIGWLHIVNFVLYGVLILVFARGLAAEFPTGKASKAGPLLLSIIGIGAIGSGLFVTEPASMPPSEWAWHGWVHVGFATIAFLLFPVLPLVYYRRFRQEPAWRSFAGWSLLVAVVNAVLFVITFIGAGVPGTQGFVKEWAGVLQRLNTSVLNTWLVALAVQLYARSQHAPALDRRYEEPVDGVRNPR